MLSIVIPVYNRGPIVGRTLRSVEDQTMRPLKVILVDNGSTDDTEAVLRAWQREVSSPDFEVITTSEKTPGAAAARNTGLALVDTPWVMFFDSDDTMRPCHCERAMDAATDEADIVGWDVALSLPGGKRTGRFAGRNALFDNIFHGGFATQRWCARTDTVRRAGGWNPSAMIWNDIEFGTRLISSGARICRRGGEPTVDVEFSEISISNEPWLSRLSRIDSVLDIIKADLPADRRHYADFKRMLAAGEAIRLCPDPRVRAKAIDMYHSALSETRSKSRRMLMRLAFNHIRHMPHGAVAILSLFLR